MKRQHALIASGVMALIFLILWVPEYLSAARAADADYWLAKWREEDLRVMLSRPTIADQLRAPSTEDPQVKLYWDAYQFAKSPKAQQDLDLIVRRGWQGAALLVVVSIGLYLGSKPNSADGDSSSSGSSSSTDQTL